MKFDPGIHIVMHSVLSLKPGVTPLVLFVQAFEKISFSTEAGGDHESQGDIISEDTETMHEPHEEGDELEIVEYDRHDAHEPRQATGQTDEGENIPEIVEEF